MARDAFPTRVLLMQEHGCFPLWDRSPSPAMLSGPFAPGDLGLSHALEARLTAWNGLYEKLMGSTVDWPSPEERLSFRVQGHLLAGQIQGELGSAVLVLYPEDDATLSRLPAGAPPVPNSNVVLRRGQGLDRARAPHVTAVSGAHLAPLGAPHSPIERRPSIAEQLKQMPDSEFDALTAGADLARYVWQPERMPTRLLLEPQPGGLPLLDRSALLERPSDRVEASALGLSAALVERLHDWNGRWAGRAPRELRYLLDGRDLAAEVQRAVGPRVTVLFPEADAERSRPSIEVRVLVTRLRERAAAAAAVELKDE